MLVKRKGVEKLRDLGYVIKHCIFTVINQIRKIMSLQDYSSLQYNLSLDTENKCQFCLRCVK